MSNLQEYFSGLPPVRDRRLKARVTPRSLVDATFGDSKAIVINVSESGMALAVGNPPAATNCLIRIRFQLPTSGQSIEIFARIVRITKSKKGVGVRLIDLTPDARAEIANWIASEKSAVDFGLPAQILQRNKKTLEISARQTKRIFSSPDAGGHEENAGARYATIFPSESGRERRGASVDSEKAQGRPLVVVERTGRDASEPIGTAASEILANQSSASVGLPAPQAPSKPDAAKQARAPFTGLGWQTCGEKTGAKGSSRSYIFDLTGPQLAALVYVFALIGLAIGIAATKASVDVLTAMGYGPFAKHVRVRPPSPSPGLQLPTAPPPDLASKEWALNIKPGVPPAAVTGAVQGSPDKLSDPSAGYDSAKGNSAVASTNPALSAKPPEADAENGWAFRHQAISPAGDSDSTPAPSQSASPATAEPPQTQPGPATDEASNIKANAPPSEAQASAESEASASRKDLGELTARSATQSPTNAERAASAPLADAGRGTSGNRSLTSKNAIAAESKSSAPSASQKHAYAAVVVNPRHGAAKNRTRLAAKSENFDGKASAGVTSKRSRRDAASAANGGKRDDFVVHATKTAARERTKLSGVATKRGHPDPSKESKRSPAIGSHTEHATKSGGAKKSMPNVAAKKDDTATTAKNIPPAKHDSNSSKTATKSKKAPAPSNPMLAEKRAAPTVAAASPRKGIPGGSPGPVADLLAPAPLKEEAASSASSEPANPAVNTLPKITAPEDLVPPAPKPTAPAVPNPPAPNPALSGDFVSVPTKPGRPQRVTFPQKQIANSSWLVISSQLSVVVPAASGGADQPSRLQAGKLVSYALPHNPRPGDRYGAQETVKVQATVGQQGLVTDIKPVSGPIFLLSSTMSAVRSWRYKPTLVNGTPIETHQDVTITFKLAR